MEYQYALMMETAKIDVAKFNATTDAGRDFAVSFQPSFKRIEAALEAFPDGPWEITSHSFTLIGHTLLASFVIRAPKN